MQTKQRGFTLVELVITLAIMAILLAMSVSSFRAWISNTRVRAAAESISAGLELAKSEAIKRNTGVLFSLVDSLGSGCALVASSTDVSTWNWIISTVDPVAKSCPNPSSTSGVIQLRMGAEAAGASKITVRTSQPTITFNGLSRVTSAATYQVSLDGTANCGATAEAVRCLDVVVSFPGGQVRMCDPAVNASSDPRKCE